MTIMTALSLSVACEKSNKDDKLQGLEGNWTPLTMSVTNQPAISLSLIAKGSVLRFKNGERTLQLQSSVTPGKCKDADGSVGLEDAVSSRESKCIHKAAVTGYTTGEDKAGTFVLLDDPTTNSPEVPPFGKKVYYKLLSDGTRLETSEKSSSGLVRITTWKRKTIIKK